MDFPRWKGLYVLPRHSQKHEILSGLCIPQRGKFGWGSEAPRVGELDAGAMFLSLQRTDMEADESMANSIAFEVVSVPATTISCSQKQIGNDSQEHLLTNIHPSPSMIIEKLHSLSNFSAPEIINRVQSGIAKHFADAYLPQHPPFGSIGCPHNILASIGGFPSHNRNVSVRKGGVLIL
nr:hypothetical protein Iba_chr13cCG14450 [Ipomoea batatas]